MSKTEHRKGTLTPVGINGQTVEEKYKAACNHLGGTKLPTYRSTWEEYFDDVGYRKMFFYNDVFYEIHQEEVDPDNTIANAIQNNDGTVDFEVRWHNGGASFDEVLVDAFAKADI
jgi:hypothetical protein